MIMPLIWRYLLGYYLKLFLLVVLAFIAIVLVLRLEEIAYFATLAPTPSLIALFIAYQIPYILPLALPLASLLAGYIAMRQLSLSHEIVAMRSSGIALRNILAPLLLMSGTISLGNFYVLSEIATAAHRSADALKSQFKALNPLILLQSKQLLRLRGAQFTALGPSLTGEMVEDCLLTMPRSHSTGIDCLVAKKLKITPAGLQGTHVSLLTEMPVALFETSGSKALLIDNAQELLIPLGGAGQLLQKKRLYLGNDSLELATLRLRWQELNEKLGEMQNAVDGSPQQLHMLTQSPNKSHHQKTAAIELRTLLKERISCGAEFFRRLSIALALPSFTLLGIACGLTIGRETHWHPIALAVGCTLLYFMAFFLAKGVDSSLAAAAALHLFPLLIVVGFAFGRLYHLTYKAK